MEGLDSTMIAVAIPDMAKGLGESPLRLNLVITTYLLSLAVFIPVSGWIADRSARVPCSALQFPSLPPARHACRVLRCNFHLCRGIGPVRIVDEPADDAGDARSAGVWRRDDDTGRPADPAAQLSPFGSRLGDELDDDSGDDRADRRPDRRRLPDDLSLVARDFLSQPAARDRRRRAW